MRLLSPEEIKPPPLNLAGARVEYLKGVTAERLLVLNLAVLAGDSRIVVHEEVV
jgi:purine-binding chemotaxis protein CheW